MKLNTIPVWKEAPFVRLLIPFIAGILIQSYGKQGLSVWLCIGGCSLCLLLLLPAVRIYYRFNFSWWSGVLVYILLTASGALLMHYRDPLSSPDHFTRNYVNGDLLMVVLDETPSERKAYYKSMASVKAIYHHRTTIPSSGKLVLYLKKDAVLKVPAYGSRLLLYQPIQPMHNTGNPGSFDFASYSARNGIFFQAYLQQGDYTLLKELQSNRIGRLLPDCRQWICNVLRKFIPREKECGLAEALLVGYKEDLEPDLLKFYTNTGVVHVIAISGLHLGILYIIFKRIFDILPFLQKRKFTKSFLIIVLLWLFSFLTGGSPSVLRSAVMFTAIVAGESLSKKISMYNGLAASAFLLLFAQPSWIFDIGFQLSYTAVLSIVVFMKPIYNSLYIQNKLLDLTWQMCAVTLSAQLLTTPISMFYFHQFPNYFLPANLIAVPLSGAILVGELILCAIAFLTPAATLMGQLVQVAIRIMNSYIELINALPYSVIKQINLDFLQVIMIYIFIGTAGWFLLQGKKSAFYIGFISLYVFTFSRYLQLREHSNQSLLIVYNLRNQLMVDVIEGRTAITITGADKVLPANAEKILQESHDFYRIKKTSWLKGAASFSYKNKNILLLDNWQIQTSEQNRPIDVLVVSNGSFRYGQLLFMRVTPGRVVLDATNTNHSIREWESLCKIHHIPLYTIVDKGAFVLKGN